MQPNQDDFQFIMNPDTQTKSGPAFLQNPKQRNIFAVVFVLIILTVVLVFGSLLFSGSNEEVTGTSSIAAYQNELIRLSNDGLSKSGDPGLRARLTTLKSFLSSDYASTVDYLAINGVEFTKLLAASRQDPQAEVLLSTAAQRNQYDEVLQEILTNTIAKYKANISEELQNNPGPKKKILLNKIAENIVIYDQ